MADRCVTTRYLAQECGMSRERVCHILNEVLGMHKVSARWVPKLLTPDQKLVRMQISRANLHLFQADAMSFKNRCVTMHETWIHHFQPESKSKSMQWKHPTTPTPKKAKAVPAAGKVMASVFWDSQGVIMVDCLHKGESITGAYYANLLRQLWEQIKIKCRGMLSRGILFLQDNAPVYKSAVAMAALHDCGFTVLQHTPYSPDLAPSDFHLFRHLKNHLAGRHFSNDDDVIAEVTSFLEDQEEIFYVDGIVALEHRWQKCVDRQGDYVEK
ncbi:histone-lysine N-methyltransferase SETMAR-like [Mantella aurantiaca]